MKIVLYVVGVVLVLVGVLGFIQDPVLGVFELGVLLSAVNVIAGLVLLWGGFKGGDIGRLGPKVIGAIYAAVAVLGLIPLGSGALAALDTNLSGTVLQVAVAAVLLYAVFGMKKGSIGAAMPKRPQMPGGGGTPPTPPTPPAGGQGGGTGPTTPTSGQQ